jgi:hypothetical protein
VYSLNHIDYVLFAEPEELSPVGIQLRHHEWRSGMRMLAWKTPDPIVADPVLTHVCAFGS